MIDAIIFSRNRPMQLHCLLESIEANFEGIVTIYVLFAADKQDARDGYQQMAGLANFRKQSNFKDDFAALLRLCGEYVTLFVDDDIVFRKVQATKIDEAMCDDIDIVSLRLGDNIRNKKHFQIKGSLDGNVYKKQQLGEVCAHEFSNPNKLEIALCKVMKDRSMAWFNVPKVIGIPANRVSDTSTCDHMGVRQAELNQKYMDGWRIDWRAMNLNCHDVHKKEAYVFRW